MSDLRGLDAAGEVTSDDDVVVQRLRAIA
jgi:hypothetical protein